LVQFLSGSAVARSETHQEPTYASTMGELPCLSDGGTFTVNEAELARLMLVCGGSETLRWVVDPVCFVDGGVDRGGLVTAVVGDEPVDGEPPVAVPLNESVAVAESTGSEPDASTDDSVTDGIDDPELCTAEVDGAAELELEDAVETGPMVCGPGWFAEHPTINSAAGSATSSEPVAHRRRRRRDRPAGTPVAARRIVTPEILDGS
jgi:hypothetical protein